MATKGGIMKIRRLALSNVTSFNERQQFEPDKAMTILIGPNGGGKSNLLNTLIDVLRTHFVMLMLPDSIGGTEEDPILQSWTPSNFVRNGETNFERHWDGKGDQLIELDLELTESDFKNIQSIQKDFKESIAHKGSSYAGAPLGRVSDWSHELLKPGAVFSYELRNGSLRPLSAGSDLFIDYLRAFEAHRELRARFGLSPLSLPTVHLNVLRAQHALPLDAQLANANAAQMRKGLEGTRARGSGGSLVQLAVLTLAQKYLRLIYEHGEAAAKKLIIALPECEMLTNLLKEFGYTWQVELTSRNNNGFGIRLFKQGKLVNPGFISSGEQQLLSMAIAMTLLDIKETLVIVDEPELHLHPVSQRRMLNLFLKLTEETGNQFILATHSPLFVTPESINYVARVSSVEGESRIATVNAEQIPRGKHAFQIINAQNNEKIFFADKVVLVEGPSDEIFFSAFLKARGYLSSKEIAVVRVGGKGLFNAYSAVLKAFSVPHAVIADIDYLKQVGSDGVKSLFTLNDKVVKELLRDPANRDGEALTQKMQQAIENEDVAPLKEVWAYIQSNRGKLMSPSDAEQLLIDADIHRLRSESTFVLSAGVLEDYLPAGFKDKDQNRLIALIGEDNWLAALPQENLQELDDICALAAS
ncbi:AAA family ATPase [Rhodoferax mekongensis]|uniref:AAA family ATPase n=1 Tax=Rhodoferax mekongensis TaxID=3068341 RepID=UPI0028BE107C|nr:AAA family ATPase [Rhodoferax sp. TBRC 17199]